MSFTDAETLCELTLITTDQIDAVTEHLISWTDVNQGGNTANSPVLMCSEELWCLLLTPQVGIFNPEGCCMHEIS